MSKKLILKWSLVLEENSEKRLRTEGILFGEREVKEEDFVDFLIKRSNDENN